MVMAPLLIALWFSQTPAVGLPPALRAELPPGKMATYEIRYSLTRSTPTPAFPNRLHIPSAMLEEPGIWGEGYLLVPPKPETEGQFAFRSVRLGPTWWGWDSRQGVWGFTLLAHSSGPNGHFGVPSRFDPCLYGFFDPDVETRADLYESDRSNCGFSARCPSRDGGLWVTEGTWYGPDQVGGRLHHANESR